MEKKDLRIVYMGTPDFAVESLKCLVEGGYNVVGVITMPDKPMGRHGSVLQPSPVKQYAVSQGLRVLQPERLKDESFVEELRSLQADLQIVVAFRMLPEVVWNMPRLGTFNLHASLLPQYRGAAPINWAVINGDEITGVTTMRMDVGLDTGDIIAKKQVRIAEDETGGSLFDKLAAVGAELCVETMQMLENKTATFTPQDNEASTHTKMISKELGDIDWKKPAVEIERLIRGLNPWPSAYTHLDNKAFKIWKARVVETDGAYAPGCICKVGKNTMVVQTGEGGLELLEVQLAGKKRMDAGSFLRGYPVAEGSFLQQ